MMFRLNGNFKLAKTVSAECSGDCVRSSWQYYVATQTHETAFLCQLLSPCSGAAAACLAEQDCLL